jgi:hypothetical protein
MLAAATITCPRPRRRSLFGANARPHRWLSPCTEEKAMPINIEGEMRDLLNSSGVDGLNCYLGTATLDGRPQISIKGSLAVFDHETLSYWERAKRTALENITDNPQVVIFYRNPVKRLNWRFHGIASLHESGEVREKVVSITPQHELDRDPERKGIAVLVRVNKITELSGKVVQER